MSNVWQLQKAKNDLSRLVDKALTEGHQVITRHGHPQVVVLSMRDYQKFHPRRDSLVDFLRKAPLHDVEFDRNTSLPRNVKL